MARNGWHMLRDADGLVLARHLPARFDVSAVADFPICDAGRLARQVRQDLWRALQNVRGFSPVVRVDRLADGLRVTAGGRVPASSQSASVRARLEDVLNNPKARSRWLKWAGAGKHAPYVVALFFFAGSVFAEAPLEVPSGQAVSFHEMLSDQPGDGPIHRFRFIAPEIGQEGRAYEDVEGDMQHLCETFALPQLAESDPQPQQIVISFSQSEIAFGEANPDVIQFFEAYRVENETCILEFF
ncbi:DUF6497 family protein [Marivita sp. S0852]|uniref:DUF6497 family protein n=1 Tax=Marivita sp. S0852 TaxID=3373893 RepID=UPI003981A206